MSYMDIFFMSKSNKYRYLFYTYKITFLQGSLRGKYYIGKHKSRVPLSYNDVQDIKNYASDHPDFDSYVGSGVIPESYFKSYSPIIGETYDKEIIKFYDTDEECSKDEKVLIGSKYLDDDMCCNFAPGGQGGLESFSHKEDNRAKISQSLRQYYKNHTQKWIGLKRSERNRNQISKTLKEHYKNNPGTFTGKKMSEESKKKNSESHKQLWKNPEYREKCIKSSKEYWENHTSPCLGKHLGDEHKRKLSEFNLGKPNYKNRGSGNGMFGKIPSNARPVLQIDCETLEVINEYHSCNEAARIFGSKSGSNIGRAAGKMKKIFGYYWKYKDQN